MLLSYWWSSLALIVAACNTQPPASTPTPKAAPATPTSEPAISQSEDASATPEATAETADESDEGDLAEQIAQMALINPPPQLSEREPGITITPCEVGAPIGPDEVEGETYTCGIFTVPMNWDAPAAGNLDLSFVVAKATGENPSPDPLVYLAGGPGQSAAISAIVAYDKIRPTHDIVRLAQRGTGYGQRLGLEKSPCFRGDISHSFVMT